MTGAGNDIAVQRAEMPSGAHKVLDRRTLEKDNKNLCLLLKRGMTILDVGCGSGSITSGMAEKTGSVGRVVGIDTSVELISMAQEKYKDVPNLSFLVADILEYETDLRFDLISSARTLQWLRQPVTAIIKMKKLLKADGLISVLDYNHEKIEWQPSPPQSMLHFYKAFLQWRDVAGMNNRIGDDLEYILKEVGLNAIHVTDETETSDHGEADFDQTAGIWKVVAETRGLQLVKDGYITETERLTTIKEYNHWLAKDGLSMKMYLRSVTGYQQ